MKKFTDYNFHMHTEIVFGKDAETKVAELVIKYGGSKVMMIYGGGSIKKTGLYDSVVNAFSQAKIPIVEFGGVMPNPRRSFVDKGLKIAEDEKVDFFLGIGGASALDTTKAIALGAANDGNYWQFYKGTAPFQMAPVGAIPTISAAGSETSGSSVLVDDIETKRKTSVMSPVARPVFAIMNPELTYSVPLFLKGAGVADILSHVFMRYFIDADSYLGDQYCEGTMRTVVKYGPIACNDPTDYEAHAEIMLAGTFAHNDLLNVGRYTKNRGGDHGLERQISGYYDTIHGAGIAVVMPALLQYIVNHGNDAQVARVARLGVKVFDAEPEMADIKATANEGIRRLRSWLSSLGMPLTLKELGIPKTELAAVIDRCSEGGVMPGYFPLDSVAVTEIFTSIVE